MSVHETQSHHTEVLDMKTTGSDQRTILGFHGGLEHLKIETRLIDKRFEIVMGECVI